MSEKIKLKDIVATGYCATGVRAWTTERNIDLRKLSKEGLEEDEVRKLAGDAITDRILKNMEDRE